MFPPSISVQFDLFKQSEKLSTRYFVRYTEAYLLVTSSRVVLISTSFKVLCSDCCLIQDATPNLLAAGDGLCNF